MQLNSVSAITVAKRVDVELETLLNFLGKDGIEISGYGGEIRDGTLCRKYSLDCRAKMRTFENKFNR